MKRIVVLAAAIVGLAVPNAAQAHTTYCGHYWKEWTVALPNGFVRYSESHMSGYGYGPHFHNYRTSRRNADYTWTVVHWHYGRQCPIHPV